MGLFTKEHSVSLSLLYNWNKYFFSLMYLHYNSFGSDYATALIILHKISSSSDNWHLFSQVSGGHFYTFTLDAHNHGRSPYNNVFHYQEMAEDAVEFVTQQNLSSASLLGHSIGGKMAAFTALLHPELINKLIVVDRAPHSYHAHHDQVFDALTSIDLNTFTHRKDKEGCR